MPRPAAWPLALMAVVRGLRVAWRYARLPGYRFEFTGQGGPVRVDGILVHGASVAWRGPLAFVRWRDHRGRSRHLTWWPDTLPGPARRELRLAAPLRRAARRPGSVAP